MAELKLHTDIAKVMTTSGWSRRSNFFYKGNVRIQLLPTKATIAIKSRVKAGRWVNIGGAYNGAIVCKPDLVVIGHIKIETNDKT